MLKFHVRNPRTGQVLVVDPTVRFYGWKWSYDPAAASIFTRWSEAASFNRGEIVDQFGVICTQLRAWRANVL